MSLMQLVGGPVGGVDMAVGCESGCGSEHFESGRGSEWVIVSQLEIIILELVSVAKEFVGWRCWAMWISCNLWAVMSCPVSEHKEVLLGTDGGTLCVCVCVCVCVVMVEGS